MELGLRSGVWRFLCQAWATGQRLPLGKSSQGFPYRQASAESIRFHFAWLSDRSLRPSRLGSNRHPKWSEQLVRSSSLTYSALIP